MVCQFCLRPVRNLRRVCGSCRHSGRGVCLFCGLPFPGQSCLCLENPEVRDCSTVWVARLALPIDASLGPSLDAPTGLCAKCRQPGSCSARGKVVRR